jgi:hypothetical protein
VLCFAIASILTSAIMLSLSRGGWIAALIGATIVIWFALLAQWRAASARWARLTGLSYVAVLLGILAVCALYRLPTG